MRRNGGGQRDPAGRSVHARRHAFHRAHRTGAAWRILDGELPSFDRAAHQHFVQHRRATRPDLLHEREIRQLEAGRIRGAQRRSDHIRVGAIAAQHNIAQGERHGPGQDLRRGVFGNLERRHVVVRLEQLGGELVALADFGPVILVHRDLGPGLGIEVRVTPHRRHQVGGSDGGLLAEAPPIHQFVYVSHLSGQSFLEVCVAVAVGDLPFEA